MDKLLLFIYCCIGYFILFSILFVHGKELSCNHTPYPHVCNHYLGNSYNTNTLATLNSSLFHEMALKVTMEQAIEAHKVVSSMALNDNNFKDNKQAKSALKDCLELYEDTIYQLKRSMKSNINPNDRLTWQSASIANHQTCENGFIDFNLHNHYLNYFPISMLTNFSKLLSNSLSISKYSMAASSSLITSINKNKNGGSRRLLSNDDAGTFPYWVSASDRRRLLQVAVVPKADIVVAQDGSGNHKSISEGVAAAAKLGGKGNRVVIHVKAGVYRERVDIKKGVNNIMMIGDGMDSTIVTGNNNAQDGSTTFRSATFAVMGDGFIARDITFENTAGPEKHQAVALRSGADHSVFYRCSFKGYQDTLYVYANRQFYRDCNIYGTVDFIFGDAVTVLENCNILVRKPMSNQQNSVTAQGRSDPNENTGIILHNCHITASGEMKGVEKNFKTFLGRPWQKYSRTVILKSEIDGLISAQGWSPWSGGFALSTLYYGEYMNTGVGSNTAGRVKWPGFHLITDPSEALRFTVANFLNGHQWIPATGVPFLPAL